jgi:outer membrane phospholipase A
LQLQSYEDNTLGYTSDSDDKPFIDFTVSFRTCFYPFDYLMKIIPKKYRQDLHLNFAFTGRFGQYMGTRYSSPVIAKRFNPVLFFQYCPKNKFKNLTLQFGYGHESNGQSIDDSVSFFKTAALPHNNINETIDKVSRGWDYVGTSIIADFFPKNKPKLIFEGDITVKYYLNNGILQGRKEEYQDWERGWKGANYTRNSINRLAVTFTCFIDSFFINKVRVGYETGITNPFANSSVKLLLGIKIGNFPIAITYRYGYSGDLAQYGKLNNSFGFEYIVTSYNRPDDKRKR